ncbi:hypothetical protein ABH935_009281 [Catenulispora sp. GAS73]|uniref:hypothetical protein n=1 Tax=Catenulispora sp. GAS73 TaxID=3156269 RepID=UPI0035130B1D
MVAFTVACGTTVLLAAIGAWLVARVAHDALNRAEPQDVPEVVAGLPRLLVALPGVPSGSNASPMTRLGISSTSGNAYTTESNTGRDHPDRGPHAAVVSLDAVAEPRPM